MNTPKKILILRFSSIGDIVLTTPVIRSLASRFPEAEIHYLTKTAFAGILEAHPLLHKVISFNRSVAEVIAPLKSEKYDLVVDLHHNLRSLMVKLQLRRPSVTFDKINLRKFMAVNFKMKSALPAKHIVDRYFEALAPYNVQPDSGGLEFHIPENSRVDTSALFFKSKPTKFIALVIGGSYFTKKIPVEKLTEICRHAQLPIVLLGGKEDKPVADELRVNFPHLVNCSGLFTITQSASIISQADWVITSDTGLMHIAAAFQRKIISVWGNTIPEFGMFPYRPAAESRLMEISGLRCRPCSKLGFSRCPRKHFRCMMEHDFSFVKDLQ